MMEKILFISVMHRGISYNPFYKVNADILEKIRRFLVAKNKPNESNAVIGSRTMYTACLRECNVQFSDI